MSVIAHCACGQLAGLRAEIERLKVANADGLRDGLEARADAEVASRQLAGAVEDARALAEYVRWLMDGALGMSPRSREEVEHIIRLRGGQ